MKLRFVRKKGGGIAYWGPGFETQWGGLFQIFKEQSPFIENFIWIKPLLRGHLSYKANFSLSQWWPLNTSLTLHVHFVCTIQSNLKLP